MAFLGWLGKAVPAIGNAGFALGLSDRPVETEAGTTPNPIPALAGALTGNPALSLLGGAISSTPLTNPSVGPPNTQFITEKANTMMNAGDLSAKYLNYGLSMGQPAVAINPISNNQPLESTTSGLVNASLGQLIPQIFPKIGQGLSSFSFKPNMTDVIGGVAGGAGGSMLMDMIPQGNITDSQVASSGTLTPIGVLRLSSRGNLIITRAMKRKMKSLADTVGLAQASQIVGINAQLASAILLKTFKTRERGVTGRELRKCRQVVNKMKHFYNMIPTRTTSTRRSTTVARGVTQIKN